MDMEDLAGNGVARLENHKVACTFAPCIQPGRLIPNSAPNCVRTLGSEIVPAPLKGNFAMSRFCNVAGLARAMTFLHVPDVLGETDDQAQTRLDDALSRLDGLIVGDTPGTDTGA